MKVYVVLWIYRTSLFHSDDTASRIECMFDTREKAEEWIKNEELRLTYEIEEWEIE